MTTELDPRTDLDAEAEHDAIVVDTEPAGPPALAPVELTVGQAVIAEVVRRRGPPWRAALAGPPVIVRVRPEGVELELRIIARPGADLVAAGRHVRNAVGLAVERLLGLQVRSVTVLVDGVGG